MTLIKQMQHVGQSLLTSANDTDLGATLIRLQFQFMERVNMDQVTRLERLQEIDHTDKSTIAQQQTQLTQSQSQIARLE